VLFTILVVGAAVLATTLAARHSRTPHNAGASTGATSGGSQLIAAETAIRGQATSWINSEVGHAVVVACDPVMCADLASHGFPAGNLNVLQSTAPDPYGSQLVIATADIRSQFGTKLTSFYAPTVIASFGTGTARIDIRVIAADGGPAYAAALAKDLQARKSSGAALASNKHIAVSASAHTQLTSGQVDMRLLTALAFLAGQQPVRVIEFGGSAPGASPGVPLRWAYLAETDNAPGAKRSGYLQALVASIQRLRAPYVPLSFGTVHMSGGIVALRIRFGAPSPLGLLKT